MVVFGIDDSPVLELAGKSFVVSIVFSEAFFDGFGGMADVVLIRRRRKEDIKCSCHTTFGKWLTKRKVAVRQP